MAQNVFGTMREKYYSTFLCHNVDAVVQVSD
jgi:hypothetical protein